ncbi:cytidine deaminase [Halospeciosus flavus]|uniref:cytidine deaminase n=1 Tax=Halospeciosus flavus TaxID=3032283 RepID=A0ABD5Z3U1_9EURY|nr:cytidine deaminase [Halospeciosus flavus]
MNDEELVAAAREALEEAYVPYSEYPVGAAIETVDGEVYTGCNLENANFSNSLHAEEVAIGSALRDGHRDFVKIAVTSERRDGVTPCGMCRQTLAEFCDDDFRVLCDEQEGLAEYRLGDLIPNTITPEMLE